MEGEIAFNALLARFNTMELVSDEAHWRPSFTLRGLSTCPTHASPSLTLHLGGPMADASGPRRST